MTYPGSPSGGDWQRPPGGPQQPPRPAQQRHQGPPGPPPHPQNPYPYGAPQHHQQQQAQHWGDPAPERAAPAAPPPPPRKRRRWPLILGGFALAFVVMVGGCVALIGGTAATVASGMGSGPVTVRYELEGDGSASAVTWSTSSGISQETSTTLPWSEEVSWDDAFGAAYTVSGGRDGMGDSGPITCRITNVETGDVLAENTSNGEFANVSCDAFAGG